MLGSLEKCFYFAYGVQQDVERIVNPQRVISITGVGNSALDQGALWTEIRSGKWSLELTAIFCAGIYLIQKNGFRLFTVSLIWDVPYDLFLSNLVLDARSKTYFWSGVNVSGNTADGV